MTHYMWNFIDLVEGHQLQLTNTADRSRTYVAIYMHDNRLYMLEGTVPSGYPEPALFQQSLGFVDKDGNGIRYSDYYDNDYPAPPPARRPGAGAAQPAGAATPPPGTPARSAFRNRAPDRCMTGNSATTRDSIALNAIRLHCSTRLVGGRRRHRSTPCGDVDGNGAAAGASPLGSRLPHR
jgi:hypothetical protein